MAEITWAPGTMTFNTGSIPYIRDWGDLMSYGVEQTPNYVLDMTYDISDVKSVSGEDNSDYKSYTIDFELGSGAKLSLKMSRQSIEKLLDLLDERYTRRSLAEMEDFWGEA